jgi:hypothetical protein
MFDASIWVDHGDATQLVRVRLKGIGHQTVVCAQKAGLHPNTVGYPHMSGVFHPIGQLRAVLRNVSSTFNRNPCVENMEMGIDPIF